MVLSTFPFFLIFSMSALHQTRVLSLFIFVNPFTFPVAYANSTCSAHLHSTAQQRRFQTELSCPEAGLIIENDKKWLNWKSETFQMRSIVHVNFPLVWVVYSHFFWKGKVLVIAPSAG